MYRCEREREDKMERNPDDARRPSHNVNRKDFRNDPRPDGHRPPRFEDDRNHENGRPPKGPRAPRRDFDDSRPQRPDKRRDFDDRRPPRAKRPSMRGPQFKQITKLFQDNKEMIEYVNENGALGHKIDIFKIDEGLYKVVVVENGSKGKIVDLEQEL